jgi:hypothetical protein
MEIKYIIALSLLLLNRLLIIMCKHEAIFPYTKNEWIQLFVN